MTSSNGKKVTLATIKSFIKREMAHNNLYIKQKSSFDGMVDCVMEVKDDFSKVTSNEWTIKNSENTLGIGGAWFVGRGRDHFSPFANEKYIGYEVYNCCGSFIIAMSNYK